MATRDSSASERRIEGAPGTVSAAVRDHLRRLCLHEFPCGAGSWNKSRFRPQTWQTWRELVPRDEETDSSAEDRFLRELAIQNPLMIKDTFFCSYFRSLRVVDKGVSLVDKDLLKFLKLEELVLSANQIEHIDATNLPPTLKVLELYGNLIGSVECLCTSPPPNLQHLGLGHNKLLGPLESLYVTSNHWPNLVSLDLGFNDLTDLQSMTAGLSTLQHLRVLVLQGNPLALVPYYRGFTIDSLVRLCVLDDITVSPSEKHQFRGLHIHGDLLAREAQLVVTIGNVKGVMDSSVLDPEPGPEGPFITYSYYVTYDFVEDEDGEGNTLASVLAEVHPDSVLAEIVKPSVSPELLNQEVQKEVIQETHQETLQGPGREASEGYHQEFSQDVSREVSAFIVEEMNQMADESLESGITYLEGSRSTISVRSAPLPQSIDSSEELSKLRPRIDPRLCPSPGTVLFSTVRKPWADVIPCSYEMRHTLKDLVPVKAFLLSGTTVTIVEEKILAWPVVPSPAEIPPPAKKGEKDKKETAEKGKAEGAAQKGLKKKKELPKELRLAPPALRVLGSGLVCLEPLLAGEPMVSTVCNFGAIRTLESDRLTHARDSKKTKKAAKKEKSKLSAPAFEGLDQPEPLTVEVQIQLHQYRSTEEALRSLVD